MPEPVLVPHILEGERLDRAIAIVFDCSRAAASTAVREGRVLVNGQPITHRSHRVEADQTLSITGPLETERPAPSADASVEFDEVFSDAHVIVIEKPAGLVVHPAPGHQRHTLVNGLLAHYPEIADVGQADRPGIVHRLDRDTSGLMMVARSQAAYDELVDQLASHAVERRYRALVLGRAEHPAGTIDAPVGRSKRDPLRMTVTHDGRRAVTHYRVLETFDDPVDAALVQCDLETGRTHQIRVHLNSVGLRILGDPTYGRRPAQIPLQRPFLHAVNLAFEHPIFGTPMNFESALTEDLQAVLARFSSRPEGVEPR